MTVSDSILLQESIDSLSNYCDYYHLKLNLDKCLQISFSRKVSHKISSCYKTANIHLSKVDSVKDLGIILDSKLTFNEHIKYSYNKALKMLGFLLRICKDFKNVNSLKIVFLALVHRDLEYCSPVWNPTKVTYSTEIDRIQRKFVKFFYLRI
jgi:hypothetical protein